MAAEGGWGKAHIRLVLSLYLGWMGADRFYSGQIGWGIVKAITLGGLLVWWAIDVLYYSYKAGRGDPERGWWWQNIRMGLSLYAGWGGVDRLYNGQIGWGILKLITLGGLGVWWLIDALYYAYKAGQGKPDRTGWWPKIRLAVSVLFGWIGADRLFNGQVLWGILKLITLGGLGAWWIADIAYYAYQAGRE